MKLHRLFILAAFAMLASCGESGNNSNDYKDEPEIIEPSTSPDTLKTLGADLSQWLIYSQNNAIWKHQGNRIYDIPKLFASNGFNTARIRLFVNPDKKSTAMQDIDYVIESAKTFASAGMELCLDFHYSDTWADPGKQTKPAAWNDLSATDLSSQLYNYTKQTLLSLKAEGISPKQIQIGNEITGGMLWEDGRIGVWNDKYDTAEQWNRFLSFLSNTSKACREVCPQAKIIIHTDRSGDTETAQRFYNRINSIDYDIIGLSYYPHWHGTLTQLRNTLTTLSRLFPHKEIMIVETAYTYNEWGDDNATADISDYPPTPAGQDLFLAHLISTLKEYKNVTGLFYWFPEETNIDWRCIYRMDLNRGLFDKETGESMPGLVRMKEFLQ